MAVTASGIDSFSQSLFYTESARGMNDTVMDAPSNRTKYNHAKLDAALDTRFYILGFVIPMGLVFNTLACAVFLRIHWRRSVTVFYFFALACADNFVLVGEFIWWLNSVNTKSSKLGITFMNTNDAACKCTHFLRYFGRLLSSWLVVAICIERFITVVYPIKSTQSSTPFKAKMVIAALTLTSIVLACPGFFAVEVAPHRKKLTCLIAKEYNQAYKYWQMTVMTAFELVIPSIVVLFFTGLIISRLILAKRRRFSFKEGQEKSIHAKSDRQPTRALLAVSIAFVTLRTLYILMYPIYLHRKDLFPHLTSQDYENLFILNTLAYILAVTNYSINFLLYILSGKTFRREFVNFLLCKKSSVGPNWPRSSRSHSISSQMTSLSLRRGSYSDTLKISVANNSSKKLEAKVGYRAVRKDFNV